MIKCKMLSIKYVRYQERGEWRFVQCGHFADNEGGVSSDANVHTFWCKKLQILRNLWYVRKDKGERESVRIFCKQEGKEVNFSRF